MLKHSCENPDVTYFTVFGRRFVFRRGFGYIGWYKPGRRGYDA